MQGREITKFFFFFIFNFYIQEQLSYIPAHSTHAFVLKEN